MKKIIFLLTYISLTLSLRAQVVIIPDQNFKTCLLSDSTINTNFDTEIQVTEAMDHTGTISCSGKNISNLTGIEFFQNITILKVSFNQLTSLNITSNVYLTYLFCSNNQLTSLDVSSNTELAHLHCSNNLLTSINVTGDTSLEQFSCHQNYLTTIDVSTNNKMWLLKCNNNLLTTIDLSNNHDLYALWCNDNTLSSLNMNNGNNSHIQNANFDTRNNPNLHCIEVSDTAYCNSVLTNIDSTSSFSENCSGTGIQTMKEIDILLYPNPNNGLFNITAKTSSTDYKIELYDILGNKLVDQEIQNNSTTIDIRSFENGIYILKMYNEKNSSDVYMRKIIKE